MIFLIFLILLLIKVNFSWRIHDRRADFFSISLRRGNQVDGLPRRFKYTEGIPRSSAGGPGHNQSIYHTGLKFAIARLALLPCLVEAIVVSFCVSLFFGEEQSRENQKSSSRFDRKIAKFKRKIATTD